MPSGSPPVMNDILGALDIACCLGFPLRPISGHHFSPGWRGISEHQSKQPAVEVGHGGSLTVGINVCNQNRVVHRSNPHMKVCGSHLPLKSANERVWVTSKTQSANEHVCGSQAGPISQTNVCGSQEERNPQMELFNSHCSSWRRLDKKGKQLCDWV